MTWEDFHELFIGKYFSAKARHVKAQKFLELKHGTITVMGYVAKCTELAHFVDDYMATDMAKVRRFENGLKLSIREDCKTPPIGHGLHGRDDFDHREREIEDARSIQDTSSSGKKSED